MQELENVANVIEANMSGPLSGLKIIEFSGIGPGPMCAMILADLGATVLRIDRKQPEVLGIPRPLKYNTLLRNRQVINLDLKDPVAVSLVLELIENADALIEGFRPGTMERLGLGPERCLEVNPAIVYGRMTGWGQKGPLAPYAGHDINFLSITGVLDAIGKPGEAPTVPLNIVGDYAGGSLYLAVGILAALFSARDTRVGQVVDAAIVDGVANLSATFFGMVAGGLWRQQRKSNIVDGGAPFYDCYECLDGKYVSVGPVEPKFFAQLLKALELGGDFTAVQNDRASWPKIRQALSARFRMKTRDEWADLLSLSDVCVTSVLTFDEAKNHPHMQARGTYIEVDGVVQPAPAPRFSVTQPGLPTPPQAPNSTQTKSALLHWIAEERISFFQSRAVLD